IPITNSAARMTVSRHWNILEEQSIASQRLQSDSITILRCECETKRNQNRCPLLRFNSRLILPSANSRAQHTLVNLAVLEEF
ncbi:hypothetical protein KQX54_010880, partial [Cotesia glomerata]